MTITQTAAIRPLKYVWEGKSPAETALICTGYRDRALAKARAASEHPGHRAEWLRIARIWQRHVMEGLRGVLPGVVVVTPVVGR